MPVASTSELLNSGEGTMYRKTSAYVKELYSMNKNSKFNFYYNDYFAFGALQATIANGIPLKTIILRYFQTEQHLSIISTNI